MHRAKSPLFEVEGTVEAEGRAYVIVRRLDLEAPFKITPASIELLYRTGLGLPNASGSQPHPFTKS